MNDNTSAEKQEREIALLGLAATDTPMVTSCPSDDTLARFLEGALTGQPRETLLAHLNRCASCYHHWLEVASFLNAKPGSTLPPVQSGSTARVWWSLQSWWVGWKLIVPVAATAVIAYAFVLWLSLSFDLNDRIDRAYAFQDTRSHNASQRPLPPLPWENATFGFSGSQSSAARRAFGAGLWAGRQALSNAEAAEAPPAWLSPSPGVAWPDTAWADYFTLGRWIELVSILAEKDDVQDWQRHAQLLDSLLARFRERVSTNDETPQVVNTLSRLQPLFATLAHEADASRCEELRRALEIAMQELAP